MVVSARRVLTSSMSAVPTRPGARAPRLRGETDPPTAPAPDRHRAYLRVPELAARAGEVALARAHDHRALADLVAHLHGALGHARERPGTRVLDAPAGA